ncbi:hypothetical protein LTR36_008544 [Oleoguttula mirabilis]|uniref:Elongin-A n=1 Tax=Oleoguttula mirabilis TaxID=1507867 RepID=A0AAV9JTJ6_9PEZI|nr:hypothetical protein LTR36_008544 [Oleoguttula mirabilis]
MAPPTLQSMAVRSCIRSLPGITDVADTPYELIKPVLRRIQNPHQLHEIETNSPHIADADAELWRAFIARDIPQWQDKIIEPKNPRSWWKVYGKLVRQEERAKEEQEAKLTAAMSGLKQEREANRAQFVGKVIPQGKTSSRSAFVDGVRNTHASSSWGTSDRTPALQNAKRGKDIVAAIRKQSALAASERGAGRKDDRFSKSMVPSGRSQIQAAPAWMVREQQKPVSAAALVARTASLANKTAPTVFAPKRAAPTATDRALNDAIRSDNVAREASLRALTQPKAKIGSRSAASSPAPTAHPTTSALSPPGAVRSVPSGGNASRPSIGTSAPNRIPSPNPAQALLRKRPGATGSPLMPAKRRKV